MRWILILLFLWAGSSAHAQEWNRFRGPNGTGISPAEFPVEWTDKDYQWTFKLPGRGNSSPVVWQQHVYATAANDKTGKRFAVCVNVQDGKRVWEREFAEPSYKIHKRNSIATSTPCVDADRLYLAWATPSHYVVQALDRLTGADVWQKDLGPYVSQHGFGASPILYEDLLILTNEQDKTGSLHALDVKTGNEVWRIRRNSGNATYSAPCIYQPPGRAAELIFTNWQHGITAVEPRTGKIRWEISCFEPKKQERAIASPIIAGDLVIGTCGFVDAQKHFVAVRPAPPGSDGEGKVKEVWRIEKAVAYMPTPIVKGERIYCCSELGIFSCVAAATGKVIWQQRIEGQFSASPICAGEAIYCINNDGDVIVLSTGDAFKQLGSANLGEATQSTPAIAADVMILRTQTRLLALGKRK